MKSKQTKLMVAFILTGVIIVHSIAFNSCSGKPDEYVKSKADTTLTFVILVTPFDWAKAGVPGNVGYVVQSWRITKDTFTTKKIDSTTSKTLWQRDTSYIIEVPIPLKDSLGKPILDSLKNQKVNYVYPILPQKYILKDFYKYPNKQ